MEQVAYWKEEIETLPRERLEEIQLQMNKLGWSQAIECVKAASSIGKARISSRVIRAGCSKRIICPQRYSPFKTDLFPVPRGRLVPLCNAELEFE